MLRPLLRIALLSAAVTVVPASTSRAQVPPSASFRDGFFGPFDGYGAIWAYPTDFSNGPSPYYSPIFNSMAASRPSPTLEPSPYARSPFDRLRFNRSDSPGPIRRLFGRR